MQGFYIGSTVLNVTDMNRAVHFWTEALGYKLKEGSDDETFRLLYDPTRAWSNLALQLTDKPKTDINRLHLDLYAADQPAEVARLKALGAGQPTNWTYPPNPDFVVLTDPDGNEFCVIDGQN